MIGGLGVFMLGLEFMANGIQALSVNKMREWLARMAGTPVKGVLAGTLITGIIQSSTAMTVMTVGLVNAGVLGLRSAISRDHGRQYRHHAGQRPDRAAARPARPAVRRRVRAGLRLRQERPPAQHRVGLHGLCPDLLRPEPDDRWPEAAAQACRKSSPSSRCWMPRLLGRRSCCVFIAAGDHRADPLLVGHHRHRHGPGRLGHPVVENRASPSPLGADLGTTITSWMASLNLSKNAKRAAYAHISLQRHRRAASSWRCSSCAMGARCSTVMACFGVDPGTPVIVDGKETFPGVPIAVGIFSIVFNIFNMIILFPFVGTFERCSAAIGHTERRRRRGLLGPRYLSAGAAADFNTALPAVQQEAQRHLRAGAVFLDIACNKPGAPRDPHRACGRRRRAVARDPRLLLAPVPGWPVARPARPRRLADRGGGLHLPLSDTLYQIARRVKREPFSPAALSGAGSGASSDADQALNRVLFDPAMAAARHAGRPLDRCPPSKSCAGRC